MVSAFRFLRSEDDVILGWRRCRESFQGDADELGSLMSGEAGFV
jgi:hypothetical protein